MQRNHQILTMPLKANRDADAFCKQYLKTQPQPVDVSKIKFVSAD